jgi:hypothetical protein
MKAYWGSGSIAPRILDLCIRWRWVVSFTPRPLYPQGRSACYPLDRRLGWPQSRSGRGGEENNSQPLPGLEPPIIQSVAQRYTTELSRHKTYKLYGNLWLESLITWTCLLKEKLFFSIAEVILKLLLKLRRQNPLRLIERVAVICSRDCCSGNSLYPLRTIILLQHWNRCRLNWFLNETPNIKLCKTMTPSNYSSSFTKLYIRNLAPRLTPPPP